MTNKLRAKNILEEFAEMHGADRLKRIAQEKQGIVNFKTDLFDKQIDFIDDPSKMKSLVAGRRCLAKGTLVATPKGPVEIENLLPGDEIYGFECGEVHVAEVAEVFNNGKQPVVEMLNHNKVLAKCTGNHKWLDSTENKRMTYMFNKYDYIKRSFFDAPLGKVNEPHAYAIGALLGDGCSRQPGNNIQISSADDLIPSRVAGILGAVFKKNHVSNYTYTIDSTECNYYNEWCKGRYAHEKTADLDVIKSWNRETCLKFMAGLLDTDGSVYTSSNEKEVIFNIGMQAKPVIEAVKYLVLALWQYDAKINEDARDKYKNGSVWYISIKNNRFVPRILSDLNEYVITPSKKYKPEYAKLKCNNSAEKHIGFKLGKITKEDTYNIRVNNSTNLFLLSNQGLISNNSGKSHMAAYYLMKTCYENSNAVTAFLGITAQSAKDIIWDYIEDINLRYKLGGVPVLTTKRWKFPNGSTLNIYGADNQKEIRKQLGKHNDLAIVDECGEYGPHLKDLVYSALMPTLMDKLGTICVIGTPGPIAAGFWHEATKKENAWSKHSWNILDNPKLPAWSGKPNWRELAEDTLEEIKEMYGYTDESPEYIRQYLGQWCTGSATMVYNHFVYEENTFDVLPDEDWKTLIGVDFGISDPSAIVVGCYSTTNPNLYIVDSFKQNRIPPEEFAKIIKSFCDIYDPIEICVDGNGIGAAFVSQFESMYSLPLTLAEKRDKVGFIELMNDSIRQNRLLIKEDLGAGIISEITNYQWKDPVLKKLPDFAEDHLLDALLYLWRSSLHYIGKIPEQEPQLGTDEYEDMLIQKEIEMINNIQKKPWWDE